MYTGSKENDLPSFTHGRTQGQPFAFNQDSVNTFTESVVIFFIRNRRDQIFLSEQIIEIGADFVLFEALIDSVPQFFVSQS